MGNAKELINAWDVGTKKSADVAKTLHIIFLTLFIVAVAAVFELYFLPKHVSKLSIIFGGVVALLGAGLKLFAQANLGKNFSREVRIRKDHTLIIKGIHKHLRHPMYTGLGLFVLGLIIMMQSYYTLVPALLMLVAVGIYRIRVEERALITRFGDEYRRYQKESYCVIPFIW